MIETKTGQRTKQRVSRNTDPEDTVGGLVSVVTPAYNEAENLALMHERLRAVFADLNIDWEWVVVDDHSSDSTFAVLQELARSDSRIRAYRLARNSGSHTAIACALSMCRGDCAVAMAADLQDPPETIPELLAKWREGAQVVWAVRERREGESAATVLAARLYYWFMRKFVGMREIPPTGADFMLLDRAVVEAFNQFEETPISVLALITWMGFRQTSIPYDKAARIHGRSGWNLRRKLKLVVDSVTSFTYLPIRLMSYAGIIFAIFGFIYAGIVIANALTGEPVPGWSSLIVVVLVMGGLQMMMMGVLGIYLWRTLDESRRRPRFLIEAVASSRQCPGEPDRAK